MFGFGKKEKIAVIFDIGSGSVGCAYVVLAPGVKPRIIASVREQMVFQEDLKFERMVSSMLDALERCGKVLHAKSSLPFWSEKIYLCSFSSPWYASQTRIASIKQDTPFTLTSRLLADSVDQEVKDFEEREAEAFGGGVLMEHEAIQVKLNGYETDRPLGKEAKTADIAVYVSIVPEKIFSLVKERIARTYHPPRLRFHSFPFSAFVVIRNFFHKESFLFIDISSEVTDVSLVRGGILQETSSFPYGKNHVLRAIGGGPHLALSTLAMHRGDEIHEENSVKIERKLASAGEEWLSLFRSALEALTRNSSVPPDIFFTADSDISSWFAEKLRDEKNEVRPMEAQFWNDFVIFEKGVERDAFLALLATFAGKSL